MRVLVQHRSRYSYPSPALLGPQLIRLRPADHARARIESYRLEVTPEHRLHWQRDPHGNHIARATFKAGAALSALEILVELAVDIRPINPFDFFVDDRTRTLPFIYPDDFASELGMFLDTGDPAYRIGRLTLELLKALPQGGDTVGFLVELCGVVKNKIAYVIRDEAGVWTPEETLTNARGSCRDSAVLLVALLRARGIAARFVSGYLVQLADEGMIPDEPKGVTRDVVDLHAWAEAFVPGAGWIGLDGTSGLFCGEGHIPLACTASPAHAAPLDGTSDVAANALEFQTSIGRLGHEARPTAPYTEDVWRELLDRGAEADASLVRAGLDVTVGGEPTFTARDNVGKEEWQGGAIGPDKWRRGQALAALLRDRLTPGGVVLHRMGKHYPGESLPRWALDVVGRADGAPLWPLRDLAHEATPEAAHRLGEALASELGLPSALRPAFEDPWEVLRAESRLPPDVDPRKAGLDDPEERRRLAQIFDRGAGGVVGWVLPLARGKRARIAESTDAVRGEPEGERWATAHWKFRRSELFLLPGDSPIGLRLPLTTLAPGAEAPTWGDGTGESDPRRPKDDDEADADEPALAVRTALAIEPRGDQVWVFLPPLASLDDFCALVAALDRARVAANVDCALEGYGPVPSPELRKFAVTPDPGVLEVNLPPTKSSQQAADLHATVFEAALASGLTAERYLLDGRLAGSGGGNHITIGGPTTAQSPWLVRPDLLASLITFAQHHPSLSYMFSGLFVGPTSQAPRVDEARHDALYELELALPRLHDRERKPKTWEIDALVRNILVDVAGSTHRAEISIDKLFDPRTPYGRQGLVELRAFEMPPHPRMAAAQMILVRALVAAFEREPYTHALVRWGVELHDRFLLPFWMWRDFEDVLAHLERVGFALPREAFRPFVELRCPLAGSLDIAGAQVEIRNAVEPWHVLGEEATQTGTARYVDSSIERLEIRTIGLDPERYVIAVNGITLPLRAASRDVRVGGVRFRAWCPPHALHPHLGIHHPVHFDVVDVWAKRGIAGAEYHVWHPEGRAFDAAPLTQVEAAARRSRRFTVEGPQPWPLLAHRTEPHPDHPYTLDLRRLDAGQPMPRAEDWVE
ncbi:MAG: hypothetical protein JWO36_5378 [Myxococcales bacterium]|nr:hypothetical protein [Myxococcales bacterium]